MILQSRDNDFRWGRSTLV